MIVVADTSPLNYLILIEQIDVLEQLYERVLIPSAVHEELLRTGAPAPVREWMSRPPAWLEVHSSSAAFDISTSHLDPGEREAIQLAEAFSAEQIILDDREGRLEASRRGLFVIGTLGVLREAAHLNLLEIHSTVQRLLTTSFQISPSILQEFLSEFE